MTRRFVITCLGSYGDVFPYIGLAKALRDRGHEPVVATSASYRAAVEQEGITFAPLGPDVDLRDEAALARVMDARRGGEVVIKELVIPALEQMYEETSRLAERADVLVSHPLTFATPAVATARAMPWGWAPSSRRCRSFPTPIFRCCQRCRAWRRPYGRGRGCGGP